LHGWRAPVISGVRQPENAKMTNPIASVLALFLCGAVVVDIIYFGDEHMIYLGKKLFELIEWIAFWR
jgi:hypothetical protein